MNHENAFRSNGGITARPNSHVGGRRVGRALAVSAIAAGAALANAGGKECLFHMSDPVTGTRVNAANASSSRSLDVVAAPGGYCPGGLPAGSLGHADGSDIGDPDAYAKLRDLDAVDVAIIAKTQFRGLATRIRSIKLELGEATGEAKAEVWKVEVLSEDAAWCVTLDPRTASINTRPMHIVKATPAADVEDLAVKNPEPRGGAASVDELEAQSADPGLAADDGDAIDMFEAIELVATKIEKKELPESVPAEKITDRPQPKHAPSTGSRW